MPRIFKGIESELRLLLHPCILTGEITDIKVALFTNDPSVAIEFTDRYTIDDNILTLKVPTWAFGTMEDGVINYVIQGMHNDDAFITDRQSNYYLKTPTDYTPEEMPEEVVLGELTTMIVENGVFEYTPSDVDAWNKATIEVNVPDTNGSYDEGYNQGYEDGQNSVECPEGGCNLGEGDIYLTTNDAGFYELYAAEDGYDGWSKFYVTLENGGAIKIHKAEDLIQMFNEGMDIDFGAYCYVGGKITEIQEINVEFGNATYVLDNGFKVYRGDWIDGNPFGEDQIKVGGYIVVYGIIQDYKGQLQFKAHSQVIAYKECEGGEISCNLIKESFSIKGDWEQFTASDYGADGFESVAIDAYDYGKQKFNEGYEQGKADGGGEGTTYPTIADIYNTEDETAEVLFKGTIAVCLQHNSTKYMIVTDHTGAFYVTTSDPAPDEFCYVGNECVFRGLVKKGSKTNIKYMSDASIIDVLSRGNYVVMPTDAVELTNKDELYAPNEYGNAEMKYLYFEGEIKRIAPVGHITIITPESVSSKGEITLRFAKEWSNNLVAGDFIRMYMFTTNGDGYFLPTDIIKLTEGGDCNIQEYKWVRPSMADRAENGDIYIYPDEGFDAVGYIDLDPSGIYNEGYNEGLEEGKNQGGGSGDCNLINPIIFSESEGNAINAESVEIPTFVYEGKQHYNVWALNMAEYEEFKIQLRFQANNGGNEEPVNIFGCEDTDWDNTTFGARIYMGNIYFRMSGQDVEYPYNESAWYDVEMGYNSSKRWFIVNGETLLETDHAWFTKPSQNFMIGAINSGGNAFRPFYGRIATIYLEANGNQVWLLPKEEGHMDVYWNDRSSPWIAISGENNARFEKEFISGDGMKTITWLGKIEAPTKDEVQGQVDQYTRPAVIFEGVTEVFVEEPHKLQTDDLVETTAWISTKDTVNNKWCLWTKEGKYEGVSVLNGSAFGGDFFEAKCIRLTGITKLLSSTFFPISAEEIHFGNIEYIETSAIESMNELKKIFYTGDGNVTIDNNAIRGANPNGTLYLKNGVDETPWLERLPEGWVVERLNDDGSVNCGGDIEDYAKNEARVLNVTENGVYTSKYTQDGDIVINSNQQITGVYDDGTNFYDTAELFCSYVQLDVIPTEETRIEFWYLPNKPHMGDGFHRVLHSKNEQISFEFDGGGIDNKTLRFIFGDKSVYYTPSNIGDEWWHIIVDKNGLIFNGEEFPFDATAKFKKTEVDLCINGGSNMGVIGRLANGTYGMVKIDGTTFIPKESGYLNLTTNELCPFEQNNIGILDDGTPITKGGFLDYSVYDTGLKITEDSVIDMWFVRPPQKIDDYVFKSPLFNVRYDSNKYYIMTNGVEQGVYEFYPTEENVINITISKADGFKKIGKYTETISLSDAVLSSGNYTLLLDSKYNTYGLIKIDGNVIIPTENGFLNTTTNEYLKKVEEYGGEYVYKNPFYEYVNNTEKTPIEIDSNLIKTVNVNVIPKIKVADEKFSFKGAQFTKIPEWADIDGIEDMFGFFSSCSKLTEMRWFDASRTTNMKQAFMYCSALVSFPPLNTIRVTNMDNMLDACTNLVSVPPLDARSRNNTTGIFGTWNLNNLTDFGGLIGLKTSMNGTDSFNRTPNLTYESCINILNGLYDFTGNGETPTSNQGILKVHSNFLTTVGDEIAIATNKGWQITA